MDMRSWKKVLLQWIRECGFMERSYFNIEQSDIDVFYQNFRMKHKKTATDKYNRLGDFLKEFYPGFEVNFDDENDLSSADYIYVYSLLLQFCCVKYPETVFHEICQRLPEFDQQCIAEFFKELLDTEPLTKDSLRNAIAKITNMQVTPPRINDSFSSGVTSVSGISISLSRCDSPLKTPKRCAGTQRISPPTPKTYLLEERTKELYRLKAQLETERYEKGLLEAQIMQNDDEIKKLNIDHKRLLHQVQELKNDILAKSSDGSTNSDDENDQIQKQLLKEISQKEQDIMKISNNVRAIREEKTAVEQKLIHAEKQTILYANQVKQLESKCEELSDELRQKNDHIKYLTDNKLELEQFIMDTRSNSTGAGANRYLNVSEDCLDSSFLRNSSNSNGSTSLSSPENLGVSVVDVQLREKEHENQLLKEELKNVHREHKRLAKHLTKITQEFDIITDTTSSDSSEYFVTTIEEQEQDGNDSYIGEDQISCQEQFNVFNSCMEKIDKFQKTEKNKIRQMEEYSNRLQEENANLTKKLNKLTDEIKTVKEKLTAQEKLQKDTEKSKGEIELLLQKSQKDMLCTEKQKNKLHNEVKSLQNNNEKLNESVQQLKTKLELQQQAAKELSVKNTKLEENEQTLQTHLQELEEKLLSKTLQWEKEVKHLNERIAKQVADIEICRQTEKTIKCNYEQTVVRNEELKKESRQANTHLCEMRNSLKEKENQLALLGKEIAEFKQQKEVLEQDICSLMEEHKQEMLTSISAQSDLDGQLAKLKDQLSKMELLMASKQHECELKLQRLEEIKRRVNTVRKLFADRSESDNADEDVYVTIDEIKTHVENMLKINKDLNSKVAELQETNKNALTKIKELTEQATDTSIECDKHQKELIRLKADVLVCEKKIEEMQHQKVTALKKAQTDLQQKEQELQDQLKEASVQYEESMERIAVELKLEKEHHNTKEMELILSRAEHNEAKKRLSEAEKEIQKLCEDNQQLQQSCERLKQFEIRVVECSEQNNKLRNDIETFKAQVSQNALRLLEADKALAEYILLTKEQDSAKTEAEFLQNKNKEVEKALIEMELKLQQQSLYEEQLNKLRQQQEEQTERVAKLSKDKEHLIKENEEKEQQISKEHQNKLVLLTSLENTTDQLRSCEKEKQQQCAHLEQQLHDHKEQINSLTLQNTNLQIDLVEREAEMRLSLDDLQQEVEDYQQKLELQKKELSEKSEQLQSLNMSLMDILVIMENNFNLSQELLQKDVNNPFNYQENERDQNMQKLKKHLNYILLQQQQLNDEFKQLTVDKDDLLEQLRQQGKTLKETQQQLENEELVVKKRILQEVKRLQEDLSNLEMVNERLANENLKIRDTLGNEEQKFADSKTKIESLEHQTIKLKDEIHTKTLIVEKLQQDELKLQHTLKDKCQQIEKWSEKAQHFECQLKDRSTKIQNLEKEYQEAKERAHKNQQKLLQHQQIHQNQQAECKKLQEKIKMLQNCNDALETDVGNKKKEILTLKNKSSELLQKHTHLEQQLNTSSKKLDEMLVSKLTAETKCDQLQSEVCQLKRDLDFAKAQHQAQQEDITHLNQQIESLKVDKEHLREEIRENNNRLQKANENVSELIQEISFIRLEKEAAIEENLLLRKQLEEKGKNETSSETKLKSIIEKSQDFERKLLSAENELKSLRANLQKSENCAEKLQTENKKLRDNQETSTKRIEKLALKLGDSQAKSSKLERDNEKLVKTLEAHAATVEGLQKEKDLLQIEAKSLKERLSRAERSHEQLAAKVQNLEHLNVNLQQVKQKVEGSEIDGKTKLNKLEKMREISEEKIRKLTNSLNNAENENVKLNLEIGALNSQLKEVKVEHKKNHKKTQENSQEKSQHNEISNQKLAEAHELNHKYQEVNEKLTLKLNILKEENSSLNDQLSKAALSLQISSEKCERLAAEMEQIRVDLQTVRQEKIQIEQQHETSVQKLNKFESENTKLLYESKNQLKDLEEKINNLEEELAAKTKRIADLENEIKILKENSESQISLSQQNKTTNSTELEDLRFKLSLAEDVRLKEEEIMSQLRLDNKILHTKYQESKQRALDAAKASEERIKENRLELEGKLEKMKSKMKTLYTDEITKMKAKQDREMALIKSEMDVLKTQNAKYEEHTRKLSNQIVRLNDNILQYQKENTILSTKLKHITDQLHESERNKRPATIHVSSVSSSTASLAGPNIAPNNLAMEDEEGEVFNNTYLTDLKTGRMSELMSREVCVEELKYRNSLLPPHLRSTYAAQFDHEFPEDDIKDGPHSFDDSMSALLSTTAGGTRKKCTGVTHYKRPGPPTPSKNGGRLSLGACSDLAREILKESSDANAGGSAAVSSSKTPARFNFFCSRFSMNNTKDEKPNSKKQLDDPNLRKTDQINKVKEASTTHRLLAGVGCTSTPRKSKVHYDQRRLLDQLMTSSPSPSPLAVADNEMVKKQPQITPPDVSIIETPVTTLNVRGIPKVTKHNNMYKRLKAIAGGITRTQSGSNVLGRRLSRRVQEICTPTSGETTSSPMSTPAVVNNKSKKPVVISSSATTSGSINRTNLLKNRLRKKSKKEKGTRPSFHLRGNIFAKYRTPNKAAIRDLIRYKSHKDRFEHFNMGRNIQSLDPNGKEEEVDRTISCQTIVRDITYEKQTNNNRLGETLVIVKPHSKKQELPKNTFAFDQHPDTFDFPWTDGCEWEDKYNFDGEKIGDDRKQELVTSKDLEEFDRFIASTKTDTDTNAEKHDADYSSQSSSIHFEKLLVDTESSAPFEVKRIQFDVKKSAHSSKSSCSQSSSSSNRTHLSSQSQMDSQNEHNHTSITTATPHISPNQSASHLSRTIYGGTIIHNHRLPNINTTYVRKSSIYVKNCKRLSLDQLESSSCNDVVLITNQTITLIDIMRMWSQMDSSTRIIISFAILASLVTLLGLVFSLCSRR